MNEFGGQIAALHDIRRLDAEILRLKAEVVLLREACWREWEAAHQHECRRHDQISVCQWPVPECLKASSRDTQNISLTPRREQGETPGQ